jgi:hypothetical protein
MIAVCVRTGERSSYFLVVLIDDGLRDSTDGSDARNYFKTGDHVGWGVAQEAVKTLGRAL